MAAAETARLIASLELKDKLSKGIAGAQTNLGKFESRWDKVSGKVKTGLALGAGAVAVFGVQQIREGLQALTEVESAVSQVDGSLREVAPTWTTTGAQIATIANRIEADVQAAFDDKDIIKGAGALIRYGKLTEGNLEPALEVMTDLAAKTGSVESASALLAKALADPAKAAGKLSKSGVVLTKQQQKQIKAMTEAGDTAGAQAYLLEQLAKTTRGAARDLYGPAADAQNELNDAVEDGQKVFAEGFLPVIQRVRKAIGKGLADPTTMNRIRDLGRGLADGFDKLLDIAGKLPWGTIGDSLQLAGSGARAVLQAFTSLPPWVQTAVLTGWGLNKLTGGALSGVIGELGKGLIKGVLGMNAGIVNIKAGVVTGAGGVPGVPGAPGAAAAGAAAITTGAAVAAIAAAVATTVIASIPFIERNNEQGEAGLSKAEIAAVNYYNADKTQQQQIYKRLGYVPDKSDADSGNAKLNGKVNALGVKFGRVSESTSAKIKAAQLETKRETARGLAIVRAQTATSGTGIQGATRDGASMVASAVRNSRDIINVDVDVSTTSITKKNVRITRYGPTGGSRTDGGNVGGKVVGDPRN